MRAIRLAIIGLLVGGAFGAKLGAFIQTVTDGPSLIFIGFAILGSLGAASGLGIAMANSGSQMHSSLTKK